MLKNIKTKTKLLLFPLGFIAIFSIFTFVYIYYSNLANNQNEVYSKTDELTQELLKGRISVYQLLRGPSEEKQNEVIEIFNKLDFKNKELKNRLVTPENRKVSDEVTVLAKEYVQYLNSFSPKLIKDFENGIKEESSEIKIIISKMVQVGLKLEKSIDDIHDRALVLKSDATSLLNLILMTLTIASIIIFVLFSLLISNIITSSLNNFKNGLLSFFSYLNKTTNKAELLNENSKDEFGEMAKFVNENIKIVENTMNQDMALIDDAKIVMGRVNSGWYSQYIEKTTSNTSLEEFKNNVNQMIKSTKNRFEEVDEVLEQYTKHDYRKTLRMHENDERGGVFERLVIGINSLQSSITEMLIDNKTSGLTLDNSSDILLSNVNKLNQSSNAAAASLEETAAAIEEITSNIRSNTENISKMASLSTEVTKSASQGETLANETNVAMDDINIQVTAINDAISVIDQIAFQTNILSLNAAVEAATAGEAGRGFAVVAQEVRNLASRSAEAAKEIKQIVENATSKANEGKNIAGNMIDGYKLLNSNISHTINLISDIQNASKEQLLGIEQINDAVNQLDQQTQQNAIVASQTQEVSLITDEIAKLIVSNANEKEFIGKNDVKAKDINVKNNIETKFNAPTKKVELKKTETKQSETRKTPVTTSAKTQTNVIKSTKAKDDDEWESF